MLAAREVFGHSVHCVHSVHSVHSVHRVCHSAKAGAPKYAPLLRILGWGRCEST